MCEVGYEFFFFHKKHFFRDHFFCHPIRINSFMERVEIKDIVDDTNVKKQLKIMLENELTSTIKWKRTWKVLSNGFLTTAKVGVGVALLCDFIAGFYAIPSFSFVSGCSNTLVLIFMGYSAYANGRRKKCKKNLNGFLKTLNIHLWTREELPDELKMPLPHPSSPQDPPQGAKRSRQHRKPRVQDTILAV